MKNNSQYFTLSNAKAAVRFNFIPFCLQLIALFGLSCSAEKNLSFDYIASRFDQTFIAFYEERFQDAQIVTEENISKIPFWRDGVHEKYLRWFEYTAVRVYSILYRIYVDTNQSNAAKELLEKINRNNHLRSEFIRILDLELGHNISGDVVYNWSINIESEFKLYYLEANNAAEEVGETGQDGETGQAL